MSWKPTPWLQQLIRRSTEVRRRLALSDAAPSIRVGAAVRRAGAQPCGQRGWHPSDATGLREDKPHARDARRKLHDSCGDVTHERYWQFRTAAAHTPRRKCFKLLMTRHVVVLSHARGRRPSWRPRHFPLPRGPRSATCGKVPAPRVQPVL